MYARVIVDVPARQVNRPFDYEIPLPLRAWVEVGSRVIVPFGNRKVQGFVVAIVNDTEVDKQAVRSIEKLLDLQPPLTPELIDLSDWMSRKYVCPRITALQAMLPSALKVTYKKIVSVAGHISDEIQFADSVDQEMIQYVRENGPVEVEQLLNRFPDRSNRLKRLFAKGWLEQTQAIQDRLRPKKRLTAVPATVEEMEKMLQSLRPQAKRQRDLLQFFLQHPQPIFVNELIEKLQVGRETVRSLAEKGAIRLVETEVFRDPYEGRQFERTKPLQLNREQQEAFQHIEQKLRAREHARFLLHGVTGSGKTEVYLQAIERCMQDGKESIVLVPEIALTPQMVERFKGRFGKLVAVLHSRLSAGERYDEWRKIVEKNVKVVIGARSAIFAPFTNIGLIVIDEEHESSYKQEDVPKYHARDVAFARAEKHQAVVVLGSATPSLESYSMPEDECRTLTMTSRVGGRELPSVEVVDMREELKAGNRSMFSRSLIEALKATLERNEQAVLLLNRRGHSTFVMCRSCGYVSTCPHCEIALTYHRTSRNTRCHYCGYAHKEERTCPECHSEHIRYFGAGTQKVEEELIKRFPGIRVIRMDVDTTTEKGAHEKWLTLFRNKQADVLLGTQMVAKGLDFPDVTLVGVIAADTVLHLPDFRAAEKTFQLLTQVAGRAGRHRLAGQVIIQTYNPDHYSIVHASNHDYARFAAEELSQRKARRYPPYCQLILITFSHENVALIRRMGEVFSARLKQYWLDVYPQDSHILHEILGPVASPIARKKDRYRFQCVVKYDQDMRVAEAVGHVVNRLQEEAKKYDVHVSIDVDPQMMM